MLKEITRQEALQKLAKEGMFNAYTDSYRALKIKIAGVNINQGINKPFVCSEGYTHSNCWIEVPDEYQAYDNLERPGINIGDKLIGRREYNEGEHLVVSIISKKDKGYRTRVDGSWQTNTKLFNDYTRADGTPVGNKKILNNRDKPNMPFKCVDKLLRGRVVDRMHGWEMLYDCDNHEYYFRCSAGIVTTSSGRHLVCGRDRECPYTRDIIVCPEWEKKGGSDMIYVEGGTFQMGSDSGEGNREKPIHSVTLSSFHIGKYEITQKQWTELMGFNPSRFKGDNLPVESITWYQAVEFCNKLSEKEGHTPVYDIKETTVTCNWNANGYRLPTEAEWEFASKGGNKSKGFIYAGSDNIDEVAWYDSNSGSKTQAVGTKKANELGLYDMAGNVFELCWDWYGSYSSGAKTNPSGPDSGSYRVLRGGSWYDDANLCTVSYRFGSNPGARCDDIGFRVARN